MLGKVFNSTYYKVPSKVDFPRTFNMKAFYNIFIVIFKYFCKVRFCWNYFIIFSKDYFFIFENFISKVRLNNLPEKLEISFSFPEKRFHVEIIIVILLSSLEKFNAVVTLLFVCQLIFRVINLYSYFIKETRSCHIALRSSIFINAVWLHLRYISLLVGYETLSVLRQ